MKRLWSEMTEAELVLHGCTVWNRFQEGPIENIHYLIPSEYYDSFDEGDRFTTITGSTITVTADYQDADSPDYIPADSRNGVLAFGVIVKRPKQE